MGVHRPHIAGIHGRETDCAYSIVLSGGYEDDIDNGDEFLYTGSGGRDLSGYYLPKLMNTKKTLLAIQSQNFSTIHILLLQVTKEPLDKVVIRH